MRTKSTAKDAGEKGAERFPKLVAVDLDYTLWPLWVDTHVDPPLKRRGKDVNTVYDRNGEILSFYNDVPAILVDIKSRGSTILAACSRTHAPDVARQALAGLWIPSAQPADQAGEPELVSSITLFDQLEIYPGSKMTHFNILRETTGTPYSEMLFFDDEARNKEVEKLGVTFVLCKQGLTHKVFQQGLTSWRQKQV